MIVVEFSPQQKRFLRKLQRRLPVFEDEGRSAESFLLSYVAFEAQARKVWHYYRCRKGDKAESKAGIPLDQLEKALKHFSVDLKIGVLKLLLDSKQEKRGAKSARNLRNGIAHQWLEGDCKEAAARYGEFAVAFVAFHDALQERI